MAPIHGLRQLYGGAMTVELPVDLIDSSDIRQIPDHQEVFLSPTTLTSIIFEVNTYVNPPPTSHGPQVKTQAQPSHTSTTINADGSTTTTTSVMTSTITSTSTSTISNTNGGTHSQEELDDDAAKFHFTDVISPPDTLVSALPSAKPVKMADPSLMQFPAYMLAGNINNVDPRQRPQPQSQLQSSSSNLSTTSASSSSSTSTLSRAPADLINLVHQLQLLIRLPPQRTDLIVRVNIPLKEFAQVGMCLGSGSADSPSAGTQEMIAEELSNARDTVARVVATLRVADWGLFV